MPKIIGGAHRVVETSELSIDEYAGNVGTKDDRISIAHVQISAPADEPWLTLHYDEWICVLKGRMVLHFANGKETLEVKAGQTVFIEAGERFKPIFPDGGTEYVPVCIPAFRPDRCIREDAPDSAVSVKLRQLHGEAAANKKAKLSEDKQPEVLYHMTQKSLWEEVKKSGHAYFPPTFEADGLTHATAVPSRLIETANHFYQDVPGEWVCLRFTRSALRRLGITVRDESASPVGVKATSETWTEWICPHIIGGIPPQVVDAVFPMTRDGPKYLDIRGLTEMPRRLFKIATKAELTSFHEGGRVNSSLDRQDGFVHLSDRWQTPKVAGLFFKDCTELYLLEIDAEKLPGSSKWVVGPMGDPAPDALVRREAATTLHYLMPDGCVHVYGDGGVPMGAVVKEEHVPLKDGAHIFPAWL